MIKIEAHLFTPWEVAVVNEAMNIIYKARQGQMAAMKGNVPAGQVVDEPAVPAPHDPDANDARVDAIMQDHPTVVGDISPAGVAIRTATTPEPKTGMTDVEMEKIVRAHLDRAGVAKVREAIAGVIGAGVRWKVVPAFWADIVTALEALPTLEPVAK